MALFKFFRRFLPPSVGTGIGVPAFLVLIATVATILFSLSRTAQEANSIEDSLTEQSASAAIATFVRSLGTSHSDYAQWDDAVRALYGRVDMPFVEQNLVDSTATATFFDTVYLLDENGTAVFGYRNGESESTPPVTAFGPPLALLLDRLPKEGFNYAVTTGIVRSIWGLTAVAAGPVVPNTKGFEHPPTRPRTLIIAKRLDEEAIATLGENYVIKALRLATAATAHSVPITDPEGAVISHLSWAPRNLGNIARARVEPVVWAMLIVLSLTMTALIIVAGRGIREVSRREQMASFASTHDPLTGLPNRVALISALVSAIETASPETPCVLVYLDLDGFKEINDAYGHAAGDQLLKLVADRFRSVADGALLTRLGGDEFALLVTGPSARSASRTLSRKAVQALKEPFNIDGRHIIVGTSLGLAESTAGAMAPEELLRRADVAMYQAKQEGPNRYFVYDSVFDKIRHEKVALAGELRRAMANNELAVEYQPVFDAASGRIVTAEALLRWYHPKRGAVSPSAFIPVAEESGLIESLGAWAMRRAASDAVAWPGIRLAVNVSPAQFRRSDFASMAAKVLADTGFAPELLEIEVTETYFLTHPDRALTAINALRRLGVTIVLDDFGTGYSSIGYLRRFKFDKLKLDRSLVANLVTDSETQRVVHATIALATSLGLRVTAEGIETEDQALLVRAAGCHELQGFLFDKALTAAEMTGRLHAGAAPRQVISAA